MTPTTHHVTFTPDAHVVPLLRSPSNALISERSRKKDFPSVAKLLDGLSFQDETHPDFLLRASSRLVKPRTANPLLHRSAPSIDHPALYLRSSPAIKSSALLSSSHHHPLARLNTLEPSHPLTPSPSIPLLIQRSSDSSCTTTSSFSLTSPTSSSSETRTASLKRPYHLSSASSEDDDDDDNDNESESDQSNTAENCLSDSERPGRSSSAFGLGIVWQTELGQSRRADYAPRPIVHPSLSWLSKHAVDRSTITPTTTTTTTTTTAAATTAVNGVVGRCLGDQKTAENHLFAELLASQSLHIRQVDKRRREFLFFFLCICFLFFFVSAATLSSLQPSLSILARISLLFFSALTHLQSLPSKTLLNIISSSPFVPVACDEREQNQEREDDG